MRTETPSPSIDESLIIEQKIRTESHDNITDQSEDENTELNQSQSEEMNETIADDVIEPPIVFEAPPIPALKHVSPFKTFSSYFESYSNSASIWMEQNAAFVS